MAEVVSSCRFNTLNITSRTTIREFVNRNKLEFKPGKGFYQLVKPETIQTYKEIVARRKSDNVFVSSVHIRTLLGIPSDPKAKFKFSANNLADFDIFVQSTSHTRKLDAGTEFLYEADAAAPGVSMNEIKKMKAVKKASLQRAPTIPTSFLQPSPTGSNIIEIVICFDTTGSMGSCIMEVRKRVQIIIERLLTEIPNIRICAYAHGDYCDAHKYVTTYTDFTCNVKELCDWVRSVDTTYGGDWEECYELALHEFRTALSWTPGSQRSVVMIGDAIPHEKEQSERKLDWREELDFLVREKNVRIYSVQCEATGGGLIARSFWKTLADKSGGMHLVLDQFTDVIDYIMAICFRERGAEHLLAYEDEVKKRDNKTSTGTGMNKALHDLFANLKKGDSRIPSTVAQQAAAIKTPYMEEKVHPSAIKKVSLKRSATPVASPAKKLKVAPKAGRKAAPKVKKPPSAITKAKKSPGPKKSSKKVKSLAPKKGKGIKSPNKAMIKKNTKSAPKKTIVKKDVKSGQKKSPAKKNIKKNPLKSGKAITPRKTISKKRGVKSIQKSPGKKTGKKAKKTSPAKKKAKKASPAKKKASPKKVTETKTKATKISSKAKTGGPKVMKKARPTKSASKKSKKSTTSTIRKKAKTSMTAKRSLKTSKKTSPKKGVKKASKKVVSTPRKNMATPQKKNQGATSKKKSVTPKKSPIKKKTSMKKMPATKKTSPTKKQKKKKVPSTKGKATPKKTQRDKKVVKCRGRPATTKTTKPKTATKRPRSISTGPKKKLKVENSTKKPSSTQKGKRKVPVKVPAKKGVTLNRKAPPTSVKNPSKKQKIIPKKVKSPPKKKNQVISKSIKTTTLKTRVKKTATKKATISKKTPSKVQKKTQTAKTKSPAQKKKNILKVVFRTKANTTSK